MGETEGIAAEEERELVLDTPRPRKPEDSKVVRRGYLRPRNGVSSASECGHRERPEAGLHGISVSEGQQVLTQTRKEGLLYPDTRCGTIFRNLSGTSKYAIKKASFCLCFNEYSQVFMIL